MKATLLAFFFLGLWSQATSQMNKFTVALEYSPNFSSITNPYTSQVSGPDVIRSTRQDGGFRAANNLFLKGGYKLTTDLYVTGAIGLFGTREFETIDLNGELGIETLESNRFHSYVVTPVGLTYYLGSFFISPEIGIGWNVANKEKNHWYNTDGSEIEQEYEDKNNIHHINKTNYPLFLSFGNEIRMKSFSIILGAKAYYDLNTLSEQDYKTAHSYGFGLLTGIRF